ncbi:MAG TPA: MGMT family protein [Actinotalea sp.]
MDEDYLEAVLDLVEVIPPGRVMTYGTIAEVLHDRLGRGGPRQVGNVLAHAGSGIPWWRVVNASGRPPQAHYARALERLREESCPLTDDGRAGDPDARVVLRRAIWWPDEQPELSEGPSAS